MGNIKPASDSPDAMPAPAILEDLRARIAKIEGVCARHEVLPFGLDAIDDHLPNGGIATGALHEIAGSPDIADDASATVFLAAILGRLQGPVIWCLRWRDLFSPALHNVGLHADRVIHVEAGSDTNVLLAMEESLRHAGIAGVVGEVGKYSTTASKRLQLAAESSGVAAFIFRRAAKIEQASEGSAAMTRWRIMAAPSKKLGIASLGRPRWHVALERVRGGTPHSWIVEGADAQGRIALPAALVDRPVAQEVRQAAG
jgi:protein ImuA